ncbi:hypothetical protein GC56T2_0443 [Geobacillus sp. C56-T2]|nr:hypothetical protein GC56T2_0443 [Geobacillus sp. C56-T2]
MIEGSKPLIKPISQIEKPRRIRIVFQTIPHCSKETTVFHQPYRQKGKKRSRARNTAFSLYYITLVRPFQYQLVYCHLLVFSLSMSSLFNFLEAFRQPLVVFSHIVEPLRKQFFHRLLIIVFHGLSCLLMKHMEPLFFFFCHPMFLFP